MVYVFACLVRKEDVAVGGSSSKRGNDMIENISGFETVTFSRLWFTLKALISPAISPAMRTLAAEVHIAEFLLLHHQVSPLFIM